MEGQHDGISIQVGVYFLEAKADDTTILNRHGKIKEKGGYREAKRIYQRELSVLRIVDYGSHA